MKGPLHAALFTFDGVVISYLFGWDLIVVVAALDLAVRRDG
jgi:hypothetical protein